MSVSAESINPDLSALVGSATDFQNRLKQLQDAKANLDAALADLQLGKSAKEAYAEATALKGAAERRSVEEYAKLQADASAAKESLQAMISQSTGEINANRDAAQKALAQAQNTLEQANNKFDAASKAVSDAQAQASSILSAAQAQAAQIISDAESKSKQMLDSADKAQQSASAALASANAERDKFVKANAAMKAAAGSL